MEDKGKQKADSNDPVECPEVVECSNSTAISKDKEGGCTIIQRKVATKLQ